MLSCQSASCNFRQ